MRFHCVGICFLKNISVFGPQSIRLLLSGSHAGEAVFERRDDECTHYVSCDLLLPLSDDGAKDGFQTKRRLLPYFWNGSLAPSARTPTWPRRAR